MGMWLLKYIFNVSCYGNHLLNQLIHIAWSFYYNQIWQNGLELAAVSGVSGKPKFQRLTPTPSSGVWYQNSDVGDGISFWNVDSLEPVDTVVNLRGFYSFNTIGEK
jgi:hypothetical protein